MTWTTKIWIAIATMASIAATLVVALSFKTTPVIVRPVVLRGVPTGTMTDRRCEGIPKGATYTQILQAYGWPESVSDKQRGQFSFQVTDGGELDYPVTPLRGWVRLCGVMFVHSKVDHVWEDLP